MWAEAARDGEISAVESIGVQIQKDGIGNGKIIPRRVEKDTG